MPILAAADIVGGKYVNIGDTRLFVQDRGTGYPIIFLHGGPGLDHREWGDYLDPLLDTFRLIFVDQRAQGRSDDCPASTWTLPQMAKDVVLLADAMQLGRYAVLGHSYGAFVALQNAVDFPGKAAQTIVSSGLPSSRYLAHVQDALATFEPIALRERVAQSWAREASVQTQEEFEALMHDQMPFHFGDPLDPRIAEFERRTAGGIGATTLLRHFATQDYGGIEVEDRLGVITQPVLVLAGRKDRTCIVEGAEAIAAGVPNAKLVVFDHSGHMTYVEENEQYLSTLRWFLNTEVAPADHPAAEFVVEHIRTQHNLLIGTKTASKLITVVLSGKQDTPELRGRDLITGEPASIVLTLSEIRGLLSQWETQNSQK